MARTPVLLLLAIVMMMTAFAAACGDDGDNDDSDASPSSGTTPASGGAEPTAESREVCDALDDFRSSLTTLAQSSNEEELKDNASEVRESAYGMKDVTSSAGLEARTDVDNSIDEFTTAIDDAADADRPFARTISVVANAIVDLQEHLVVLEAQGGCD
jgi:hypothetical protein